jgi:hypothetical protein
MLEDRRKALVVIGGSLAATGVILALVFSLSGWAYQHRESSLHDGRLKRLVDQHPFAAQVTAGILAEPGTRAIASPSTEKELRRLAASWRRGDVERIVSKQRTWPDVRVFGAGDLVYVLYFDAQGRLQGYELAGQ